MDAYYASCAAGLEFVLLSEIDKLKGVKVVGTVKSFGGVIFRTLSVPLEVYALRSADNVYAFLGHYQDVPVEKDAATSYFKHLVSKIDWDSPLQLFKDWQLLQKESLDKSILFRVTCERKCVKMKKHPFSSVDAAAAVGEGVQELHGWPADMRSYNLQVFGWIVDKEFLLVLALIYSMKSGCLAMENTADRTVPPRPSRSDAQLYSKRSYRHALIGTSLKPSMAFALLQLGQIKAGDIILDPMCGCGTIPLEAAEYFKGQVTCIGGDNAATAVEAAATNNSGKQCDVVRWDASCMPIRTSCVDWVVCDMPFGVRCCTPHVRDFVCPKVVQEVCRVLKIGTGIAILMSQGKAMKMQMEVTPYLELIQQHHVDMEGIRVTIHVARRNSLPVMQAKPSTHRVRRRKKYARGDEME